METTVAYFEIKEYRMTILNKRICNSDNRQTEDSSLYE